MARAPRSLTAAVIAYLLAMAGLAGVGVQLSLVVTANVIALTLPHLASHNAPRPSRIDQRRMAQIEAIPPMPVAKLVATAEPAVAYRVLAADLDSAEANDMSGRPASGGRKRLALALRMRALADVPAADAFNRNFGVIPLASN
jgi:hypothetical protein